ncbi:MAG: trypsin-like peptidase domain-containing protein [Candidatus Gracilibacteria bacterium]|nr:trypsin-like peptidase domain-containing protein [Candidatus Gracilibacteria bacterium]
MENKNKIIITIITLLIFLSIISGVIGSIVFNKYLNNTKVTETQTKETKVIEKITNITDLQSEITKIVKDVAPGVVSIVIKKDLFIYRNSPFGFYGNPIGSVNQKVGGGTGFFITKKGKIITNKHVISDNQATYTVITNDNIEYDAKVIATDPNNDLAILEIMDDKKEFKTLDFVNKIDEINVGQFAIAMGNALSEFQNSVSLGVISGKNRNINDGNNMISGLIQTDAAINPGNSGGPLINLDGKVMGINTAIIQGSVGIGFSIGLTKNKIDYMLKSIDKYGVIKKPYIGINYIPINEEVQNKFNLKTNYGLYVVKQEGSVVNGSPAEIEGIKPGDIITKIDKVNIGANYDLNQFIQGKIPGEIIRLTIIREGEPNEINIDMMLGEA